MSIEWRRLTHLLNIDVVGIDPLTLCGGVPARHYSRYGHADFNYVITHRAAINVMYR